MARLPCTSAQSRSQPPLIPSTKLHMRAYCFGISPYADQFLLLLLLRAERPREQCLLRLGAAGGRQRPERDHYSHSGGAASRRQREQHHRRRRRDRRAGPNRHVSDHNTTPQAATPSHQFRHSPKVKTRRSHRLSNVRFRSAHASASDCARRQRLRPPPDLLPPVRPVPRVCVWGNVSSCSSMMAISSSNTRLLAMVLVNTVPVFTASLVLHTRLAPLDNHRPVLSARSRLQPHQPPLHLPPRLGVLLSQRLDLSLDGCPNLVEAASEIPVQLIRPRLQGVIALPLLS